MLRRSCTLPDSQSEPTGAQTLLPSINLYWVCSWASLCLSSPSCFSPRNENKVHSERRGSEIVWLMEQRGWEWWNLHQVMNPTGCAMCTETGLACACTMLLTKGDEASIWLSTSNNKLNNAKYSQAHTSIFCAQQQIIASKCPRRKTSLYHAGTSLRPVGGAIG